MSSALPQWSLYDAHCHPQDDPRHLELFLKIETSKVAAMGTKESDWQAVEDLYKTYPSRVRGKKRHPTFQSNRYPCMHKLLALEGF
jgi:Tat protein secretion system quality control protein TatD with DNase activity